MLRVASSVFEAIAHPVRRRLLETLLESSVPLTVTELGRLCEVSRSTASRHLGILRGADLVHAARGPGLAIHHRLNPDGLAPVDDWVWPFLSVS